MDSWANGKERLLKEFEKVYDAIGVNLTAELDLENTIRVQKTGWEALKEDLTRCSKFAEENARLAGELEKAKGAAARVEELEQDNRRLQRELAAELEEKEHEFVTLTRARPLNKPSPTPSDPAALFAANRVEHIGAATVSADVYNRLVKNHNVIYNQWKYHKTQHERLEEVRKKFAERLELWQQAAEDAKSTIAKKDSRIQKLKARVETLESGATIGDGALQDGDTRQPTSIPSSAQTALNKPWLGAVAGMTLNTDVPESRSHMANEEITQDIDNDNNTSRELAARPDAEREETPDLLLDLAEKLGIAKPTGPNTNIIQDSEDEDEGEEAELSLPKLPRLSQRPELSEHHDSSTIDEDIGPRTVEKVSREVTVKVASSSSPVLVSTRQVKKRKSLHGAKTPAAKVKLEEIGSSSPTRTPSSDSLDLDDIGQKTATPRKRRRLTDIFNDQQSTAQASRSRVHSQLREVTAQVSQETPIRKIGTTRTGSALQPLSVNKQIVSRAPTQKDPKGRRIADDNMIGAFTEDGAGLIAPDGGKDPERTDILVNLLDNPSPQKQVLSPIRSVRSIVSAKRQRDALPKSGLAIHRDVAESGEPESPRVSKMPAMFGAFNHRKDRIFRQSEDRSRPMLASSSKTPRQSEGVSRSPFEDMTEPQRPNFKGFSNLSTMATPRPTPRDSPGNYKTPSLVLPKSRTSESVFGKNVAYTTPAQAANTSSKSTDRRRHARVRQTVTDRENDPEQEPLRIRPIQTLRLEDFKINPNYNQGYKHAFVEVVRDKDQRQQLHACTKPGCCGEKFRALAIVGRNFDLPRTSAEKISDDRMMKEFLGDNAHKLARMSKDEKVDLWIQARTRQLAQQHGRHRNAYERQPTPPGFWEVDFPTTQEQLEQKEKAEDAIRLNVKQRYEEAMRPNGAYIFADE